MRGDMQVRFGGRYGKTYRRKAARRPVPSLREGKGGNIFALAGEFIKSGDFLTQARYVAEVADMPMQDYEPRRASEVRQSAGHSFEDVEVLPLQSRALLHYLQERGIPSAIAIANCKEMRYTTHGKRYFAVAFGNCGGGYEIRNPFFKGCVPPKDVTLLSVGADACNVYEGFMDYLSARALGIGGREDGHRRQGGPPCPQFGVQCGKSVPASGRLWEGTMLPRQRRSRAADIGSPAHTLRRKGVGLLRHLRRKQGLERIPAKPPETKREKQQEHQT